MFGSWANRKAGSAKRSSFWSEQSIFRQTQRYNNTEHNIYNEKMPAETGSPQSNQLQIST